LVSWTGQLRLYKQGKKDGLSIELIRADTIAALDGAISDRQIRNIMPLELKYSKFANNKNKSKSAANGLETIETVETVEEEVETISAFPGVKLPNVYQLILGDCTDPETTAGIVADNSIDLIFTDPQYNREFIPFYCKLGELALRVLKPGGSLVTYFPQYVFPTILIT
jgi:hypothetical protein